jgi:hypothetical protein
LGSSKLQEEATRRLNCIEGLVVKENHRFDWLKSDLGKPMELDLYIEDLRIAVEVQGVQHSQYNPFFHKDIEGFKRQLSVDKQKRDLCSKHGILFYEIERENELLTLLTYIKTLQTEDEQNARDWQFKRFAHIHPVEWQRMRDRYLARETKRIRRCLKFGVLKGKRKRLDRFKEQVSKSKKPKEITFVNLNAGYEKLRQREERKIAMLEKGQFHAVLRFAARYSPQ